jgi:quercetin dioxygenase-like cupin family protein
VADWVHYHRVAVQMIVVRRGWVRVVYQNEGEPFVMKEGDLVLQPPGIRHRVLESSAGLEVIEISAPALHGTFADHELELPNGAGDGRLFEGQRFLHHRAAGTDWTQLNGAEVQETQMFEATGGLADVLTFRSAAASDIAFKPHDGELVFGFVLDGTASLDRGEGSNIAATDAFVIPPDEPWALAEMSSDFRLLHVTTAALPHIRSP